MNPWLASLAIGAFLISTIALALYGIHLYVLLFLFRRRQRAVRAVQRSIIQQFNGDRPERWPVVTSQIPIYNERNVASRVIMSVAEMNYPAGRHEIQILDDSNDGTSDLIDEVVRQTRRGGIDIRVIRRPDRKDYKAGALANGLSIAAGKYVAVFDADFVPPTDFLVRMVPLLEADDNLACMQGRWSHLNENESWLTRAQALGIDGHFAIEQGARAWNGLLMNFNGTAGVWRKTAIEDPRVGGWSGDTLTEDLDLSYRAQLAGWRIDYCLDVPCPAELPNTALALKGQQRRWATGSIQVARKLLPRIWRSESGLSMARKCEATLHLTHYSVSVWMLLLAIIARPTLTLMVGTHAEYSRWLGLAWCGALLSALAPTVMYVYARFVLDGSMSAIRTVPSMFVVGMGMCLSNAIAVVRGLTQRGGEFVRTPKSGSNARVKRVSVDRPTHNRLWLFEILLGFYSFSCFGAHLLEGRSIFSLFLLLYGIGFLTMGWYSRPTAPHSSQPQPERGRTSPTGVQPGNAPEVRCLPQDERPSLPAIERGVLESS